MKRSLFFLALGAVALTACTSEEVIDDAAKQKTAIQFEQVVNKSSRADVEDLTGNGLEKFCVFGFYVSPADGTNPSTTVKVFDNVLVTKTQGTTDWTYAGETRYWVPGAKYYFYAYSCGSTPALDTTDGESGKGSFGFNYSASTPNARALRINGYLCDHTHQHDLIFASNTGAVEGDQYAGITREAGDNTPVSFQFQHLLSKVKAEFASNLNEDYNVEISNVRIENVYNKADFSPTDGNWDNYQNREGALVYLLNNLNDESVNPIDFNRTYDAENKLVFTPTNHAYVLPKAYGEDEVNLKFNVRITKDGALVIAKEMQGTFQPTWQVNHNYTYKVTIDGNALDLKGIVFTVDYENGVVVDWSNNNTFELTTVK